ncbi:MAG TPA: galactonate dehydratase [Chloroflexota bacterium]|jgi:L-alanine-DL-glutamate epimerase-like enolase superfamily enzyme|nr:galactonate dehydratase [Chloroflexota bacterium]
MKISDVKTFVVGMTGHNAVLVKVETDEGLYGIGEASLAGREQGVIGVLRHFRELLVGRDPARIEDTWQNLYRNTFWRGGPVLLSAISGIDIALWDLKGRRLGAPLYDLLGGKTRERVRVYTHVDGATDEECCQRALAAVERGYTALRVVPALFDAVPWDSRKSVRASVRRLEKLRQTVGEDVDLLVDVHHRFTPMENVRLGRAAEEYDLFFIEDPVPPDNLQSYRLMRSKIHVPLATGEAMVTKWSFKYLIEHELIDYLRIDPVHVGGVTETKKIAVMGEVHDIDLALHNPTSPVCAAVCVHVDASSPNFGIQEAITQPAAMREIFPVQTEVRDGYFEVPDRPGLGLEFDEAAALRHSTDRLTELPHIRRVDGSVTDW